ncbi:MAG: imidazoleglycerol-phosphate dehydratase HisB [Clostridia bacterium]|jgi:imidazoleglycerol-phosphate dehydratase|nr:imidazoleglycerol-phosphate dehydratase HisB [Clostridia bacterium]MBT7122630.1 imidazoleglycerol-phosphate dehydratase HisB [Clostridia bacterium]
MRTSEITRKTNETEIALKLNVDGSDKRDVSTGLGIFDHMLDLFAKQGKFDLSLKVNGDLNIDEHHTIEDVGIALGDAFAKAIGDKKGIYRYATQFVPMDETLAMVSLDFSGRAYLQYGVDFFDASVGGINAQMFEEFFRAFATSAKLTLHISVLYGTNTHHMIEAVFKAVGRAVRFALESDPRESGIPSTKGVL